MLALKGHAGPEEVKMRNMLFRCWGKVNKLVPVILPGFARIVSLSSSIKFQVHLKNIRVAWNPTKRGIKKKGNREGKFGSSE